MSDQIKSCFMDEQPGYYFDVVIDGKNYGSARMKSKRDQNIMYQMSRGALIKDENGDPVMQKITDKSGTIEIPSYSQDLNSMIEWTILLAFGGSFRGKPFAIGTEHWNIWDKTGEVMPCTLANVKRLTDELKGELYSEISAKNEEWLENKEAISKN